jgi:hypothetical protein
LTEFRGKPLVQALLLSETVIRGQDGKNSVVNIFDRLLVPQFPATHQACAVYGRILDASPGTKFTVQFVDTANGRVVLESPPIVVQPDFEPRNAYDVIYQFFAIQLEHAGRYEFRLFADGLFLAHVVLNVEQHPGAGGSNR